MLLDDVLKELVEGGVELLGLVLDRFQDGADFIQAFRHNGIEHRHGPCTGLGGTYGAEFEFIACEGKRAGAVPVGGVQGEHGQGVHADVDGLLGARFFSASFLDLLNDFIQQISQEDGNDMALFNNRVDQLTTFILLQISLQFLQSKFIQLFWFEK